jgi:uncharacterized membrane protein
MSEHWTGQTPRVMRTGRLEAFSDGVLAIAITILVLEIGVPPGSTAHLLEAVREQWPSYLAYVVSFSTIGVMWLGHSTITEYMRAANSVFARLNLVFLLTVCFLPFPTRLLAEAFSSTDAERVAATIYGLNLIAANAMLWVLWRYANRAGLVRTDAEDAEVRLLTRRLTPSLGGYLALLLLGLLLPLVAVLGYLALAFFLLVPLRDAHAARRAAGRSGGEPATPPSG